MLGWSIWDWLTSWRMVVSVAALVAGVVLIYEAVKPQGPSKTLVTYCKSVRIGQTTVLSTETALGKPDSQKTDNTLGPELILHYGGATFFYDRGSSRLVFYEGC